MALSSSSTGGANTDLTGLTPEQIAHAVQGNIAGSKLGLDSVQNIYENMTKQAYADYLREKPEVAEQALASRQAIAEMNNATKLLQIEQAAAARQQFLQNAANALELRRLEYQRLLDQGASTLEIKDKSNQIKELEYKLKEATQLGNLERLRDQDQQKVNKRLSDISAKAEGITRDKNNKLIKPSTAELEEFNSQSTGTVMYVPVQKPGTTFWFLPPGDPVEEVEKVQTPNGIPASKVFELYRKYVSRGNKISPKEYIDALKQELGGPQTPTPIAPTIPSSRDYNRGVR